MFSTYVLFQDMDIRTAISRLTIPSVKVRTNRKKTMLKGKKPTYVKNIFASFSHLRNLRHQIYH